MSNFSLSDNGSYTVGDGTDHAQGFVTDGAAQVTGVKFVVVTAAADSATETFKVSLHQGAPDGTELASESFVGNAHDLVETSGEKTVTFDSPVTLAAGATYYFVFTYTGSSDLPSIQATSSYNADSDSLPGWSMGLRQIDHSGSWVDGQSQNHKIVALGLPLSPIVEDDDYTFSYPQKEITATVTLGSSDLHYAFFDPDGADDIADNADDEDCDDTLTFPSGSSYTSGTPAVLDDEGANGKAACFRATYSGTTYYAASGKIAGIDTTAPTITAGTLAASVADGIDADEISSSASTALISTPTAGDGNLAYAVIPATDSCSPLHGTAVFLGAAGSDTQGFFSLTEPWDSTSLFVNDNDGPGSIVDDSFTLSGTDYVVTVVVSRGETAKDYFKLRQSDGTEVDEPTVLSGYSLGAARGSTVRASSVNGFNDGLTWYGVSSVARKGHNLFLPSWIDKVVYFSIDKHPYGADVPTVGDIAAEGSYKVCTRAYDGAGNAAHTTSPTFTRAAAATTYSVDLKASSDTGTANDDNITNDTTPTIVVSGLAEDVEITITADHASESDVTVDISDSNNDDESDDEATLGTLAEGEWSITATDGTSTTSALVITVDTTAPSVTTTQSGNTASVAVTDTNGFSDTAHYLKNSAATCDSTLTWGGTSFNINNNIQLAAADNDDYVCVRAQDKAGNYGYDASPQISGVTDFTITVTDDSDGTDPEREKEIKVKLSETTGVTNTVWGFVDSATDCSSSATLSTAYTASTTDQTVTASSENNNGQHACFKATKSGTDYYQASAEINGIDRTPPAAPGTPDLDSADDTGRLDSDNITKNTANLTIAVSAEADSTVALYNGGTAIPGAEATATSGTASIDITLAEGTHTITAKATDAADNESSASGVLSVIVDTTDPVIQNDAALAGDVADGYLNSAESGNTTDLITAPTVTDTNSPELSYAVIASGASCDDTHTFSTDIPQSNDVTGADGGYLVCIKAEDTAGNTAFSTSLSATEFLKDTTTPTLTIVTGVAGEQTHDGVDYLNYETPTSDVLAVSITASESTKAGGITATLGGLATGRNIVLTKSDATTYVGSYTIQSGDNGDALTLDIPEAVIFDLAGNPVADRAAYRFNEDKSDLNRTNDLVVDTIAPVAPTGLDLAAADDTCADFDGTSGCDFGSNSDDITSQRENMSISVTREAHAAVTLSGGASSVTGTRAAATTVTLDIALSATDGDHSITATQEDRAGNVSDASTALVITLDRTAPSAPPAPDLHNRSDSGNSPTDNLTNRAEVALTVGTHTRTEECRFAYEGTYAAAAGHACVPAQETFDADGDGTTDTLSDADRYTNTTEGEETFTTRAYDLAGNHADSGGMNVRFDRTVAESTFTLAAASDSGYRNDDRITKDNTPDITLSGLEFSAAPTAGTGAAAITLYDWTDADSDGAFLNSGEPVLTELSAHHSISDVTAASMDVTLAALGDGVKRLVIKQEDDAGNISWSTVSKVAYDETTGDKGDNVIIIDTVSPEAPALPDLSPYSDTYGANDNYARNGTDSDDLTYEYAMLFRSVAAVRDTDDSADKTLAELTRERHHLTFSVFDSTIAATGTPADGASAPALANNGVTSAVNPDAATANNREISNVANGTAVTGYGFPNEYAAVITHDFSNKVAVDETDSVFIGAKQYDAAGNESAWSTIKEVTLDREKPAMATFANDLILHSASDTGVDDDRRTANTTPVFTMEWPENITPPDDIDYYELHRALLDSQGETAAPFAYPSDSGRRDQASFDWVDPSDDTSAIPLNDETTIANTLDTYTTGVAVKIFRQDPPEVNKTYGFRLVAVDRAGNTTRGVDQSNPTFTVPPPTPDDPDLAAASDTGSTDDDNLTKNTMLQVSTAYRNTSTEEQEGQAAQNLRTLAFTVIPPSGTAMVKEFTRTPNTSTDNNGFDIPTDEATNLTADDYTAEYTFSNIIDLTELFGDTPPQGTYTISIKGVNSSFEEGNPSGNLTVTLDTEVPVLNDTITLTSSAVYKDSTDGITHTFTATTDLPEEEGTLIHLEGLSDLEVAISGGTGSDSLTDNDYSHDFSGYTYYLLDKAGNSTDFSNWLPLPDAGKPPRVISYVVDETANTYLVSASAQNDGTLSEVYTQSDYGSACDPSAVGTDYTPNTVITVAAGTTGACMTAKDSYGNTTSVHIRDEAAPLITETGLPEEDDTGAEDDDRLTKNPNPRYTGITIPGSTTRIQGKRTEEPRDTVYEETVTADDTGRFLTSRLLRSSITGSETLFTGTLTAAGTTAIGYDASSSQGTLTPAVFTIGDTDYTITVLTADSTKTVLGLDGIAGATIQTLLGDYALTFTHGQTTATVPITAGTANGNTLELSGGSDLQTIFTAGNTITTEISRADGIQPLTVRGYLTNLLVLPDLGELGPFSLNDVTVDVTPPTVTLALTTPASSPGNDTTPTFTVTTENRAAAGLYTDAACTETAGSPVTLGSTDTTAAITTDTLTEDGTYTFYARSEDRAGNTTCSEGISYTLDTTPPSVIIIQSGNDYRAVANEDTTAISADSTAKASCTTSTTGTAYTPGDALTDADGNRCFVFTDTAGNKAAGHTDDAVDSVGDITFTEGTADGTTHYTRSGSRTLSARSAPNAHLALYLTDGTAPDGTTSGTTVTADSAGLVTATLSITTTHTKLYAAIDLTGSGTFTTPAEAGTLIVDDIPPVVTPIVQDDINLWVTSDNTNTAYAAAGNTISVNTPTVSEPLRDITVTFAGVPFTGCITSGTTLTCDTLSVTDAPAEGPALFTLEAQDRAGNPLTLSEESTITVDRTKPLYVITPQQTAGKPGDTIGVTVDLRDAHEVTLGGSPIDETNPLRVRIHTSNYDLSSFPTTLQHTIPEAAPSGSRNITVPTIADAAGNTTDGYTKYLFFVDTRTPAVSDFVFSTSGTTLNVSALVDRNNHSSMLGDEGIHLTFGGACSSFPNSPVFTDDAQTDDVRYTYSITIPRSTFAAETCHLVAVDAVGNRQEESSETLIYVPITGTRSGGGGGGGGGGSRLGSIASFFSGTDDDSGGLQEDTQTTTQTFSGDLTIGSTGEDVRQLQIFLNTNGYTIAETGTGSPGQESTYFGLLTQQALQRYQQAHGIFPANGVFDSVTRAHVTGALNPSTETRDDTGQDPVTDTDDTVYQFGDFHSAIQEAQQLLNQTTCPVADTGAGSPGQETRYFGSKTRAAVICYQRAHTLTVTATITEALLTHLRNTVTPPRDDRGSDDGGQGSDDQGGTQEDDTTEYDDRTGTAGSTTETVYELGDSHPDIQEAQQLLNQTTCPVADTGAGSPGQETRYFGSKTRLAVLCYRQAHSLTITATITEALLIHLRNTVVSSTHTPPGDDGGSDDGGQGSDDQGGTQEDDTNERDDRTGNEGSTTNTNSEGGYFTTAPLFSRPSRHAFDAPVFNP